MLLLDLRRKIVRKDDSNLDTEAPPWPDIKQESTAAKFPGEIIDQEKVESPRNKDSGSSPVKHCWQILLGRNF